MQMEKREPCVLIYLLISVILVACGPSQAERDAQATEIAANIFATQTAEAPAPTPTPLPPTPTPTPLPPTPTPTPLPPAPTPTPTPEPMGIAITGVITNLGDAEERYLAEDSYLQLVRLPADGRLSGTTDDQGRLAYDSELAQSPIPSDGVFNFQVESLEPGTYVVAAQRLRNSSFMTPLLVTETEYVRVEIRQDATLPVTFDLGEVAIPIP
jgi:hypothetical protein